jgi:sugar O-acyltransferase (sialic acid O-acetyltransferase NeuD family)
VENELIIIGASGHGAVIADLAEMSGYSVFFWDDDDTKIMQNYKVEKRVKKVPEFCSIIIGIGSNSIRERISLEYPSTKYVTLIHQRSIIAKTCKIGIGSVIIGGAIINNGAKIGDHCIINTAAVIDHDSVLSDFVHISPNATVCGNVVIGRGSWVGAGAVITQGIKIGKNCIIGAGCIIINDIPDNATVVGNPGKIIRIT